MSANGSRRRSRQDGVGLIEVLIAVLVLSVGFLAAAQMQVKAMRYSQSAYFRSQANMMLKDIVDRMRSNRAGVLAGHYDNATITNDRTMPACVGDDLPCSPADLAAKDLYEWSANLYPPSAAVNAAPLLPGSAGGSITPNSGVYDIAVQWVERIDGTDTTQTLTVQFMP